MTENNELTDFQNSKKVLIVDDDQDICQAFQLALKDITKEVVTATSGQEGIDKFNTGQFDVVFLDLNMPVISGIDVFNSIRSTNKEIPVYIISAFSSEYAQELQALKEQNLQFELLSKPIGLKEVRSLMQKF